MPKLWQAHLTHKLIIFKFKRAISPNSSFYFKKNHVTKKTNPQALATISIGVTLHYRFTSICYQRKSNHQSNQSVMLKHFFILCSGADTKTF
jgi:hypothetical protein